MRSQVSYQAVQYTPVSDNTVTVSLGLSAEGQCWYPAAHCLYILEVLYLKYVVVILLKYSLLPLTVASSISLGT